MLQGAVNFALASSLGIIPRTAKADDVCRICRLSQLHPARLTASLVFDTVRSIVIQNASRSIMATLYRERGLFYRPTAQPTNEYYKGALAYAGESDYEIFREQRVRNILEKEHQNRNLSEIKDYLSSRKIRIKSAYTSISYPIDSSTTIDDILSIEYFSNVENDTFLNDLVSLSSSTAIEEWLK